jgi:flagellar basal body-associated protein FliL
MNPKKIFVLFALIALVITPLALSDASDAEVEFGNPAVSVSIPFNDMNAGGITVHLLNDGAAKQTVTITVREYPDRILATADVTVPASEGGKAGEASKELRFSFSSPGDRYLQIEMGDGVDVTTLGYNVSVTHSIWKDSSTYILIIIVIIVIAVVAYLRMRGLPGKKTRPAKTFTEMEAEKKAGKGIAPSGGSKRQKYDKGDKRK